MPLALMTMALVRSCKGSEPCQFESLALLAVPPGPCSEESEYGSPLCCTAFQSPGPYLQSLEIILLKGTGLIAEGELQWVVHAFP